MDNLLRSFDTLLKNAHYPVFFGGAGVSCESGIPDFRSQDGLYNQLWQDPPETIISASYFRHRTEEFYRFYKAKMLYPAALPNPAHKALAYMEAKGLLHAVITQNIDGLHQAANSRNVIELHGSVHRNFCLQCGKLYTMETVYQSEGVPHCSCGGLIKPDVVLYEEALPQDALEATARYLNRADLLIIGGTSLSVYPAAAFARDFRGKVIIINKSPTPMDRQADLLIPHPIGEFLEKWMALNTAE